MSTFRLRSVHAFFAPPFAVVELLMELAPAAVMATDDAGRTPLHCAIDAGASEEIVSLLIASDPARCLVKTAPGDYGGNSANTPLHLISSKTPASAVRALLRVAPAAASTANTDECLPLHRAVAAGCSMEVFNVLLDAHLPAVSAKDKLGRFPLHHALLTAPSESGGASERASEVVSALVHANRSACASPVSETSRLPLHLAVANGHSAEVVSLLLDAFPSAVSALDSEGLAPVHLFGKQSSVAVVEALLSACLTAASIETSKGSLPLHQAVSRCVPPAAIQALVRANPAAARHANADGNLPLHLLHADTSADAVHMLLEANPAAAAAAAVTGTEGNSAGGKRPLHLAVEHGVTVEVFAALAAANQSAAMSSVVDDRGRTVAHYITPSTPLSVIERLHQDYPELFKTPAADGRLPLHCALSAGLVYGHELLAVIQAYPDAAAVADEAGNLPLTLLIQHSEDVDYGPDASNVEALLAAHPAAAAAADRSGSLPLHLYLQYSYEFASSFRVVKALLAAYPSAVAVKNDAGLTPIDVVLKVRKGQHPMLPCVAVLSRSLSTYRKCALFFKQQENVNFQNDTGEYELRSTVRLVLLMLLKAAVEAVPETAASSRYLLPSRRGSATFVDGETTTLLHLAVSLQARKVQHLFPSSVDPAIPPCGTAACCFGAHNRERLSPAAAGSVLSHPARAPRQSGRGCRALPLRVRDWRGRWRPGARLAATPAEAPALRACGPLPLRPGA